MLHALFGAFSLLMKNINEQFEYRVYSRIEVHLFRLHWEIKGHLSRENLVKRETLLEDLPATSVLSFSNANDKKCASILIFMLKR